MKSPLLKTSQPLNFLLASTSLSCQAPCLAEKCSNLCFVKSYSCRVNSIKLVIVGLKNSLFLLNKKLWFMNEGKT